MIPWHEVPGLIFLVILRLGLLMTRALTLSVMKGTRLEVRQLDLPIIPIQLSDPSLLGLGLQSYQLLVDVVREGGAELKFDN